MSAQATTPDQDLEALLTARHSCRGFDGRPVPPDVIARLLALAQRSPSWCNTQPWQVIVTEGQATRQLSDAATAFAAANPPAPDVPFPERYAGPFLERRRECAWQLYDSVGVAKGDRAASAVEAMRNYAFFGAPHVAVVTTERDLGAYGALDCGIYAGCFLLAAQSLGLASIPQAALGAVAPAIRELYDLPPERQVLLGISFGYADPAHPANGFRTHRADLADVVTHVG
jgi:nitroreductase